MRAYFEGLIEGFTLLHREAKRTPQTTPHKCAGDSLAPHLDLEPTRGFLEVQHPLAYSFTAKCEIHDKSIVSVRALLAPNNKTRHSRTLDRLSLAHSARAAPSLTPSFLYRSPLRSKIQLSLLHLKIKEEARRMHLSLHPTQKIQLDSLASCERVGWTQSRLPEKVSIYAS